MSITASPATSAAVDQAAFGDDALDAVESWVATTDHQRLGRIHLGATLLAGTVGAVLMAFVGQRLDAALRGALGTGSWLGESDAAGFSFSRIFNAAQTGLVVVVAVPMFLALASIVVPRQIGASRLAFPRLHSFVVWSYLMGAALYITSFLLVTGPPTVNIFGSSANLITGKQANKATDLFIGALALITISTLLGFINIFTTVLTHRRAGLSLNLVRPFTWASFVTAAVSIITIPAHLSGLLLLFIDQHFGGTFGSTEGSELVWSHLIRFTSRPDMYLLLIPVLGLVGEIIVSRTGRSLLGGPAASYLVGGAGALSLFAWLGGGTAVDTFLQPTNRWFTSLVVIPVALLVLVWLGSLAGGFKPDVSLLGALGVPLLLVLAAVNVLVAAARGLDGLSQGPVWTIGQVFLLAIALPVVAGVFGIAELAPLALGRSLPKPIAGLAGLSALGGAVLGSVGIAILANRDNATSSAPAISVLVLLGGLGLAAGLALTLLGLLGASRSSGSNDASHLVPFTEENL
jgi:cytochrome c oxidase subunit I